MDQLWSPWRYRYVTKQEASTETGAQRSGCVFCDLLGKQDDEKSLIVFRGEHNFVVLNLYPYTNGHLMVIPHAHVDSLAETPVDALTELMQLARRAEIALRAVYAPQGINLGMNLGECAGAGVVGHIHMHVLPRWFGDANFMTVVGETRVHIEELAVTWKRLKEAFEVQGQAF